MSRASTDGPPESNRSLAMAQSLSSLVAAQEGRVRECRVVGASGSGEC
jgi:hypothetical protein